MSGLPLDRLKMQLVHFQASERFFQAPLDLDQLKTLIRSREDEEESSSDGGATSTRHYTDFLLPLPEHLQPTEIGAADPNAIKKRREEKGMNEPMRAAEKNVRNEVKARAELKNQLKNRPGPAPSEKPKMEYSRKFKIAPRPGGFTKGTED